ncbi:MAG TPA: amino acid adenylation domain-containing protein, partial [Longimicrobiaceae bacterium]|nr:amino acid adenylation domain-containing protein [Longimicrobiaceae bacterium]
NERGALRMGALEMEPLAAGGEEITKFNLMLGLEEGDQGFAGGLSYRAELWERATMERMAGHFARLTEAVLTDPARPVSGVAFLGEEERAQVLEEWNGTAGSLAEECVHELFAAQAARTPDAPAVSFAGETLTYAGLDRRSNRLAHALRTLGVGPEVTTALCLERSPDMVVAMLAILKAGGAYVPLDPASPPERLAYMVEDSGARVLLTRERHLDVLPAGGAARVLCLDRDAALLQRQRDTAPEVRVPPRGLAYVIYTSGSTGRPKGVLVEHRSLAAFLHAMRREPGISADDGLLAVTTLSFDIAGLELFLPLLAGARTVLADRETASDPLRLAGALDAAGATVLQATPATWRMLLAAGWEGRPGLRALCGGEALSPDLAEQLLTRVAALWNLAGPPETTVWSTVHRVRPDGGAPPIGRPIAGTRVYVLDGGAEPVPPGVQGELLIGGAGVARGYHGRPELTAERFLPDPFSAEPGARMYRTGDRVRWFARGELEYLGRIDQQVKLRGFRIEPGEIEAALLEEPSVREAAVLAREDHPGERRLVGYVVAPGGDTAGLREHLRKRLPEYMVPAAIVMLDSLPLTPNGKLDRRALPAPDAASAEVYVAPRTPAEEMLAGILGEVLRLERVGAEDNFFELGGHSLLATRVVSRVREAFGVELPLRALFEVPTVAGLAGRVEALLTGGEAKQAPPLVRVARDGSALPLSFAQQRLWFIDQLEPGSAAYNMPHALRLRGRFDPAVLERAVTEVVRRHETLRTVFAVVDGEPVQVVRDASPVTLPVTDLRSLPAASREAEVRHLARDEAARPFDLAAGPLLRVSAVRLDEAEWGLLFTMHHIVSDGWSMGVLVREVSALYDALAEGREAGLPELPVQYADYAAWQRGWLAGETLEAKLGYWREKLAGAPPLLELPTDRPRPQVQHPRGASVRVDLPAEISAGLRALSRREGATAFMTLLAAWQLLLSRYSGQEDVSVG